VTLPSPQKKHRRKKGAAPPFFFFFFNTSQQNEVFLPAVEVDLRCHFTSSIAWKTGLMTLWEIVKQRQKVGHFVRQPACILHKVDVIKNKKKSRVLI
jgi:hypothetical protein